MLLTDEERDARDNGSILIGVGHAGEKNLTGSLISCAVVINYDKVTSDIISGVMAGKFTKDQLKNLNSAIKVFHIHKLDALRLNTLADTDIACYMADFNALYGCTFDVFQKMSCDPDVVISDRKIKEVVKNQDLSLYTNKNSKSSYVVMEDWNQFNNLIPNTRFVVNKKPDVFTTLFAKAFANTMLDAEILEHKQKYPGYDFGCDMLSDTQKAFLTERGLTEFHRAYLPELESFAFSKHILI